MNSDRCQEIFESLNTILNDTDEIVMLDEAIKLTAEAHTCPLVEVGVAIAIISFRMEEHG